MTRAGGRPRVARTANGRGDPARGGRDDGRDVGHDKVVAKTDAAYASLSRCLFDEVDDALTGRDSPNGIGDAKRRWTQA